MNKYMRLIVLAMAIFSMALAPSLLTGCAKTILMNADGSTTETRSIDVVEAINLLNSGLQAYRMVLAEIDSYDDEDEISEPDDLALARLEIRRLAIARALEFLGSELGTANANDEDEIQIPKTMLGQLAPSL